MSELKKDLSENNWQLAINLAIAFLATLTLSLMVVINKVTYQPISPKPECVFVPWTFFQGAFQTQRSNPYHLDALSEGTEQFIKRIYEYYLKKTWLIEETQSYYFSPVSVFLLMGYVAVGLNPSETINDYGVSSLEEMLGGMSFPCYQKTLAEELELLLKQESNHIYLSAYVAKNYDARKLQSLFPGVNINITREETKLPLILKYSSNISLLSESYFSLEPASYSRGLKFALHIGIDIFAGIINATDNAPSSSESVNQDFHHHNDALILSRKKYNKSIEQFRYTHFNTDKKENNTGPENTIGVKIVDKDNLTWSSANRDLVGNYQCSQSETNYVTFRCNSVTINRLTSISTEAIVLRNPEKTNLTLVLLVPYTRNDFVTLQKRFSGTDFEVYEQGEGNDKFAFNSALSIQLPVVCGETRYSMPMPLQMNAITRIFYDGSDGEQFHKTVTDWSKLTGSCQDLHVPQNGILHKTSFNSVRIAKLFGTTNETIQTVSPPTRNTDWKPREPLKIENTFIYYVRSQNGLIYQFGKVYVPP